jgi:hypothetical protein
MSDIVERAKAALIGVTPGPWETRVWAMPGHTVDEWFTREITGPNGEFHSLNVLKARWARHAGKQCCWPPTDADAEFIAAARSLVPELISALTAAQEKHRYEYKEFSRIRGELVAEIALLRKRQS